MIAKNKFVHLNIKQKIYKIASSMRRLEDDLKKGKKADTTELYHYLKYVDRDKDNPKMGKSLKLVDKYQIHNLDELEQSLQIKQLNFCYHDLLALINESISEKFYSVKYFDTTHEVQRFPYAAILDNIRSPFNVGNIFRSADCLGTGQLALCGITPHPPSLKIERTAMGTIDTVEWQYFQDTAEAISFYKEAGYRIAALETVEGAADLRDYSPAQKTAFIFGNEEFGITDEVLRQCDDIVELPMVGTKNSMNVANSFAILFYQLMTQSMD